MRYHAPLAYIDGSLHADVVLDVEDGRFISIAAGTDGVRLEGLTLPGLANAHSHAFHRALRGRTQNEQGTFWTWRRRMYEIASVLDPESYYDLAVKVYGEMALTGITCVGEFHYLHHGPDGTPYDDPNAMGEALLAAAGEVGIRITLLDTLYLTSTVDGAPLEGVQRRFGDGSVDAWADRVSLLKPPDHAHIGRAMHSVRAVPVEQFPDRIDHIHLSEQRAENEACLSRHGRTPTALLADHGLLGPELTAVHATHLTEDDLAALGRSGTGVCFCPTTERDLADGIGPARALADAGSPLCLGSDSHAVIDLFEEARAMELNERLRTERRGHFTPFELLSAAFSGHRALGWADAGRLTVGARADLVTVALETPRTSGIDPAQVMYAATGADVREVIVDGRPIVHEGRLV